MRSVEVEKPASEESSEGRSLHQSKLREGRASDTHSGADSIQPALKATGQMTTEGKGGGTRTQKSKENLTLKVKQKK